MSQPATVLFYLPFIAVSLFPLINCCTDLYYNTSSGVINLNPTNLKACSLVYITVPNEYRVSITCTKFIESSDTPSRTNIFDGSTTNDRSLFSNPAIGLLTSGRSINSSQNTMLLLIDFVYTFNKDTIMQFTYENSPALPCSCGSSTFTDNYGPIYSPMFQEHMNYCNNLNCNYSIEIYHTSRVLIEIRSFYTELRNDFLEAYDNDRLFLNMTGLLGRPYQYATSSNKVTLRFITNSQITHSGFSIYYSIYQDKCYCPEQNYIESFGELLSPGYRLNALWMNILYQLKFALRYPEPGHQCVANQINEAKNCLYQIVGVSADRGQTVFLNFTELRLGNDSYLTIYDDNSILLANYTWLDDVNELKHNFTSTSNRVLLYVHMTLNFMENDNQTLFKANYWLVDNPSDSSIEIWIVLLPIVAFVAIVVLIVGFCIFIKKTKRDAQIEIMQTFNAARSQTVISNDYDQKTSAETDVNDLWQISHKDLSVDRADLLGSGAFGSVYKAKLNTASPLCQTLSSYHHDKFTNCTVAVKMLGELANIHSKEAFLEEILCMKSIGYCQYLVNMHGYCIENNDYWLVLEYCARGDLLKYVRNCTPSEDLSQELDSFAWQIASGMDYLSSKQLVHRDLAARNVLLDDEKRAKIGDFGLCRQLSRDVYVTHGGRLPIKWMAIESIKDHMFASKSDVWSYGVLLFEIYSFGKEPFEFVAPREMLQLLLSGERLEKPDLCSDKIYDLMKLCWNAEQENRPTFEEIRRVTAEHITETTQADTQYLDLDLV